MKIELCSNGLCIIPETDFEADFLKQYQQVGVEGFVKTGTDLSDISYLKLFKKAKNEE